jgi:hypothetical protein
MIGTGAVKLAGTGRGNSSERHELPEVIVGKDVLELVSSAMYIDPMTIYREYIQNAADSIDEARATGLIETNAPGRVDIEVYAPARTVRIRDYGCGVPFKDFGRKLAALGGSGKRGMQARGFRGVGRLAGLGYAQELVFRSRSAGESKVSVLRWDCRQLKAALRDPNQNANVADVIRDVTTLERVNDGDAPERFFEVEMKGIIRLRNDRLMSPSAIGEYLSQVAPVPFSPEFRFGDEIAAALSKHVPLGALDIRLDGAKLPIYRPHRDFFVLEDSGSLKFNSLDVVEIPGIDGEVGAVGWVLHHDYDGAIPTGVLVKGLRLRAGNIQVGDHALLEDLFPEPRFNAWSVGELHVIDRRIVPNGRRDQFEQNSHFHNLLNHLTPTARDITRRCRTSSIRRKWEREFELQATATEETLAVLAQRSVGSGERSRFALNVEQTLLKMSKIAAMDILSEDLQTHDERIKQFRGRLGEIMGDTSPVESPLMRLPKGQRKAYEEFFTLIYECSTSRTAAKALIDRILLRISPR